MPQPAPHSLPPPLGHILRLEGGGVVLPKAPLLLFQALSVLEVEEGHLCKLDLQQLPGGLEALPLLPPSELLFGHCLAYSIPFLERKEVCGSGSRSWHYHTAH